MKIKQMTEEKVFAYMREYHMLEPGERVVAGISGGADSVCLLFLLVEWAKRVPLDIAVVHVNHGIRPEAAEDARYVEQLCRERGIPFYLTEADVHRKAADWKCSEEEAGRRVRYEAFAQALEEFGAHKIAVAHNSNDCSETMLFHLFRGSGLKGLGGIAPVRENIIRPLLCLERREIESYLNELGIPYCQDATNNGDDYTRNRIRHHILPYAEEEIVQGCVRHMFQTARMLSETEEYLEQQTKEAVAMCVVPDRQLQAQPASDRGESSQCVPIDSYRVSVAALLQQHPVIQKRILHLLVKSLSPRQKDISYVHIQDLLGLFTGEGNRTICLPFEIRGRREYGTVVVERVREEKIRSGVIITLPRRDDLQRVCKGEKYCPESAIWEQEFPLEENSILQCSVFSKEKIISTQNGCENQDISQKIREVSQNEYTKWLDYDKIKGCVEVRCRRMGDYLTIADGVGILVHKSLKDYMITQKIPRVERDQILLLAEDSHVLWLIGYRISEYYKVCENTKYILQVQLIRKNFTKGETEDKNGRAY